MSGFYGVANAEEGDDKVVHKEEENAYANAVSLSDTTYEKRADDWKPSQKEAETLLPILYMEITASLHYRM